jgi:16S rRNA (cytosine967-C5)-methyltransferase
VAADGWNDIVERLVRTGVLSPQDPTSAKPVARVAELVQSGELPAPRRILDLCAGLGTKTLQLARAFPGARVFATDVDSDKLRRLAERAKTVAQQNVEVLPIGELEAGRGGSFDLVLADVPCSNTGVMSRRVQSRWRWPSLDRSALQALQLRLLTQAAALAGGGEGDEGGAGGSGAVTVYATCSIDPAENGERVGEFLRGAGAGLRVIAEALTLPSLATAGGPLGMHDGGYFAILRRPGGRSARTKEKKG